MSDPCPICNGSGKPRADKLPCLCQGSGYLSDAFTTLSAMYFKERNAHQETKERKGASKELQEVADALRQLQEAVLGFIFHPEFRRQDKNGFFKRYWADKLNCQIRLKYDPPPNKIVSVPVDEDERNGIAAI